VTIAALDDFGAALAIPDRPGIESLVAKLRSEQSDANASLAGFVDEARLTALRARLESLVAAAERTGAEARPRTRGSANGGDPVEAGR